jgi:hypothetical protein
VLATLRRFGDLVQSYQTIKLHVVLGAGNQLASEFQRPRPIGPFPSGSDVTAISNHLTLDDARHTVARALDMVQKVLEVLGV